MNNQARVNALARTARHLTTDELDRLLHRYDLSPIAHAAIVDDIACEEDYAIEVWSEQSAEGHGGPFPVTRWAAYIAARPLYGPEPAPAGWGVDDDEVPF